MGPHQMNEHRRPAITADADAISDVYIRSFVWAYRDGFVRLAHAHDEVRLWMQSVLIPTHHVTVVVRDGVIVGYTATQPGWLQHLYIEPEQVRAGMGTRLLRQVMTEQPTGFDLWTFSENTNAKAFYEHHGLIAVAFGDGSTNEEGQPDVRYRWRHCADLRRDHNSPA